MITFNDTQWETLLPTLRTACPRLTDQDLAECEQRSDLLVAKLQNRQWISRSQAEALLTSLLPQGTLGR